MKNKYTLLTNSAISNLMSLTLFIFSILIANNLTSQTACTGSYTYSTTLTVPSTGYSESFESVTTGSGSGYYTQTSGYAGWGRCSVASGSTAYWQAKTGSTGSGGTGPSSAQNGSRYLYVEASSPNYPNYTARLGRNVNLAALGSTATLTFYRHIYGSYAGTLKVFVNGTVKGTYTGSSNSWILTTIDLSQYAGTTCEIEFVYLTGTSWSSDCGIDNLSISGSSGGGGPVGPTPTPCSYNLPFTEAFSAGAMPICWTTSQTSGDGWRFTSPTPGFYAGQNGRTNGTFAWIDFSSTDAGVKLESPEVNAGTASNVQMEFDFWSSTGYPHYYTSATFNINPVNKLYVEQYNGTSWSQVALYQENNAGWVTKTVNLAPYTNSSNVSVVKVRFRGESGGATYDYLNDILVDQVEMTASTACSGAPNAGIASKSATSGCNGGSVTLTSSGLSSGGGITYQWQQYTGGSWSNISGETMVSATLIPLATANYRIVSTCPTSGQSSNSSTTGTYTVDNCFIVPFSGNNTVTTCSGTIYDHAGTSNYSNSANGYTTIMPATSGAKVQVSGNLNSESNWDYLYIYNGTLASGTPLYQGSGLATIPTVTSTHSTGALTIKFTSDGSGTRPGFDLAIACALPCSGTPTGGSGAISSATGCPSVSVNLSATGVSTLGGITYQWQSSSSSTGPFTNVSGATSTTHSVSPATPTYYRLRSTCSNGNGQAYSSVVSRTPATFTPGSGNSNCGTGTVTLTGTATGGSVTWYTAASGGSSIGTGNSYTTPSISQTTTYYASSSGCPSSRAAVVATINPLPTVDAGSAISYCNGNSGTLTGSATSGGNTSGTTTTLTSPTGTNNGSTGAYFNLTNTSSSPIEITGFYQGNNSSYSGARTMNVYYYPSSYVPVRTTTTGWTQVATNESITISSSTGASTLSYSSALVSITPVIIPAGSTYGFYMGTSSGSIQYFTATGTGGTTVWSSNADLARTTGHGGAFPGGSFTPRSLYCAVQYNKMVPGSVTTTWSPSTVSSTSNLTTTANATSTTQYTLTAIDQNNCQAQDVVTVTVNALPTINATPAARCDNGTVDLGAAPSSGTTVNWYSSATSTSSVGTGALFTTPSLSTTTTYYAAATSPEGCITSPRESITATINALPNANGGPDKTGVAQCGLEVISLNGTNTSGASGQWTVQSGPNGLFADPTDPTTTFTPASYGGTTIARWTTTSGAGCNGTDDVEIQFSQPNTGPLSSINPQTDDLVWGGITNSAWSTGTNWYQYQSGGYWKRMSISFEPSSSDMVYIIPNSTGGTCVSSGNNATPASNENVDDLRVMSGATLNLNNGSLNVYGDIVNDGTVNPGSATVKMMGSGNQTISGTGTSTFDKLTIDKSSGDVIIAQPVTVEGTLKMTSGDIDNSSLLTLGSTAGSGNLNYSGGHIKGAFRRYFPNSTGSELLFPMKKGSMEREGKITFNQAPGPDQYLTVELKTGAPTMANNYNGLPFYASDNQLIQVYSNEGYLEIDPTAGNYNSTINSAQYTLKMHAKNMSGVNNYNTVRLIKSPGPSHTTWVPCGTHSTCSGTNSDFWVTSVTTTGFSFFGFGSNNDNPLPVELVSFNGNCGDGVVELNWTTASEHNSAYFQLEKSRDGENWDVINTQDAAGNSNEMRSYSFVDAHASAGNNLYRLSQFDIDGDSKTYSVVNVNCAAPNVGYFSTHPNPSTGEFHVVLNNQELIGTATIRMVDSRGTIVSQKEIEVMEGINVYNFNEFKVAPGMYYITVVNDDKSTETIKQSIK